MIQVDEKVLADIGKGFAIPARPELLIKMQELMSSDDPDLNEMADIISEDVALSATIIKTINSPLYGLARSISDIRKSVKYIGMVGIFSLVSSVLLKRQFDNNQNQKSFDNFWVDATLIANTVVYLGKQVKRKISSEKLFSIGLFHNCGIPVMALKYDDYEKVEEMAENTRSRNITDIEEEFFGVNHATIGYYVANSWRLPKDICQLILRHHEREFLDKLDGSSLQVEFALLKLAENILTQVKTFNDHPDWAYISDSVFTVLDIDEEDYQDFVEDITEQVEA